jgi:hypothetical protein
MKILLKYLFVLLPVVSSGQLFPNITDFRGDVKRVIERRYGQEYNPWRKDSASYKPGVLSGWKYTYLFNENSVLIKRIATRNGKIQYSCSYLNENDGTRKITREITKDYISGRPEYSLEYENFIDQDGKPWKVNFREQVSPDNPNELFLIEMNVRYSSNLLTSFTRFNVLATGDTIPAEECLLTYDESDRISRIDRKDISSGFSSTIQYFYNANNQVSHYSIDLITEIQQYGKKQIQDIYFKYDSRGNWTRMYRKSYKRVNLEAKRTIRYK